MLMTQMQGPYFIWLVSLVTFCSVYVCVRIYVCVYVDMCVVICYTSQMEMVADSFQIK